MTFLLDCSHYQGTINWPQVKAAGCTGAYVKTTDGTSAVDATWQTNHAGANAVGVPIGPYHFAEGGNVSAEAAHFASTWSAGWQLNPVLDYEIGSANAGWLNAFRTYFRQDTGFNPFRVYSSYALLTGALNPSGWVDADTTIWAARYNSSLGWNHPSLVLWQNTSTAQVAGVLGSVDEDQFINGWTPGADMTDPVWTQLVTQGNPGNTEPNYVALTGKTTPLAVAQYSDGNTLNLLTAIHNTQSAIAANHANVMEALSELNGEITAEQATLLAAIQGVQAGTVDVSELAQALVPILAPADAAAFKAALATALSQ